MDEDFFIYIYIYIYIYNLAVTSSLVDYRARVSARMCRQIASLSLAHPKTFNKRSKCLFLFPSIPLLFLLLPRLLSLSLLFPSRSLRGHNYQHRTITPLITEHTDRMRQFPVQDSFHALTIPPGTVDDTQGGGRDHCSIRYVSFSCLGTKA